MDELNNDIYENSYISDSEESKTNVGSELEESKKYDNSSSDNSSSDNSSSDNSSSDNSEESEDGDKNVAGGDFNFSDYGGDSDTEYNDGDISPKSNKSNQSNKFVNESVKTDIENQLDKSKLFEETTMLSTENISDEFGLNQDLSDPEIIDSKHDTSLTHEEISKNIEGFPETEDSPFIDNADSLKIDVLGGRTNNLNLPNNIVGALDDFLNTAARELS